MAKILVTGAAGFIGFHLVKKLLEDETWEIVGLDNINDYYDENLKYSRLSESGISSDKIVYDNSRSSTLSTKYRFIRIDLTDKVNLLKLFENEKFDYVVNLAAQAGVRYSLENPESYIQSNIVGFFNILEGCRIYNVKHLFYASSSSVYGSNTKIPFSISDNVDHPISLYAATKKSNELMAYTYSHLYKFPSIGLRFFTVYGPWGRPDMAYFSFTKAILNELPIDVYNFGNMKRDFTFINDVVESIVKLINKISKEIQNTLNSSPADLRINNHYRILNIGNTNPVPLINFIGTLEKLLGRKAKINYLPIQPGDVEVTFADVSELRDLIDFRPDTSLEEGLKEFVAWYLSYYK